MGEGVGAGDAGGLGLGGGGRKDSQMIVQFAHHFSSVALYKQTWRMTRSTTDSRLYRHIADVISL